MNIDPRELKDLREESFNHPIEKTRSSQGHSHKQSRLVLVLSSRRSTFGSWAHFLLLRMNEQYEVRKKELDTRIAEVTAMVSLIEERLDDSRQRVGSLASDVEL